MKNKIYLLGILLLLLMLPLAMAEERIVSGDDYIIKIDTYDNKITAFFSKLFTAPQAVVQPYAEPGQELKITGELNSQTDWNLSGYKWEIKDSSGSLYKSSPCISLLKNGEPISGYSTTDVRVLAPTVKGTYTFYEYIDRLSSSCSSLVLQDKRTFQVVGTITNNCPTMTVKKEAISIEGGTKTNYYTLTYINYPTCSEQKSLTGAEVSCNIGYESKGQGINAYCSKIASDGGGTGDGGGTSGGTNGFSVTPIVIVLGALLLVLLVLRRRKRR